MPRTLDLIKAPIAEDLDHFEATFRRSVKTPVPLLDHVLRFIIRRKGKQMRPLFVMLSAKLCGELGPKTHRAAALIELLHTATLVHDDVVDDAEERRGFFSINALWKNKIAVLVGDYLLARGLLLSLEHEDHDLLAITSKAVKLMSEGELLQMEKARRLDITEEVYYKVIRMKTASLIASCTEAGAASATAEPETIERMRHFGELVGMAFQIKDDLLDYGISAAEDIGKPKGIDIKEKKMTLPLIYTLRQSDWADRRRLINVVKRHNTEPRHVQFLVDFVRRAGGFTYSLQVMENYRLQAMELLEGFPESEAKKALQALVDYTISREK